MYRYILFIFFCLFMSIFVLGGTGTLGLQIVVLGRKKNLDVTCLVRRPSIERSEEHTSELQSHSDLVCRLLLEKKKRTVFEDGQFFRVW